MSYRISLVGIIRSENAAQSSKHPSKFLVNILSKFGPKQRGFDDDCGKLLYRKTLCGIVEELDLVDSEIRLYSVKRKAPQEGTLAVGGGCVLCRYPDAGRRLDQRDGSG
ncbi:MAG: hypothetical protein IH901_06595 [Proteobacteria bacterium]|nr:hypothetical protein [Pseudomonadota bacterium]